jgi:hypothetical protein
MQQFATSYQDVVAIDGKCLRRSFDKAPGLFNAEFLMFDWGIHKPEFV